MRGLSDRSRFWGKLVRELREEAGMSQRYVSLQAGVCRQTLRNIEEGTGMATVAQIGALLRLYGYELEAVKIEQS